MATRCLFIETKPQGALSKVGTYRLLRAQRFSLAHLFAVRFFALFSSSLSFYLPFLSRPLLPVRWHRPGCTFSSSFLAEHLSCLSPPLCSLILLPRRTPQALEQCSAAVFPRLRDNPIRSSRASAAASSAASTRAEGEVGCFLSLAETSSPSSSPSSPSFLPSLSFCASHSQGPDELRRLPPGPLRAGRNSLHSLYSQDFAKHPVCKGQHPDSHFSILTLPRSFPVEN